VAVDGVEVLNWIHQFFLCNVRIVVEKDVSTVEGDLFSRKVIENCLVDFIYITVVARENGMTGEVLTARKRMLINARIHIVDQCGKRIVRQLKVGRDCNSSVMEQPLVLFHLILSTMLLPSYQMNYPTLQFGCVMEQPLSPLSYLFDLINYASLILLNKLSILFHPIIVWPCG